MCTGVDLLAIGSAGVAAGGSIIGGMRGSQAARLQAEIARGNTELLVRQAEVQRGEAGLARTRGAFEETRQRTALGHVLGGQAAHFGGSGLDANSGSPLLLAAATAAQGEVDAGLIRAQSSLDAASALGRAAGTLNQAAGQAGQAYASAQKGDDAMLAGIFGAATAMLSGASKAWGGLAGGQAAGVTGTGFVPAMAQHENMFVLNQRAW